MTQRVADTTGAIGYVDLKDALLQNLRTLTIDGIPATADHVKDNSYPFWSVVHMYTQGIPSGLTNAFIQYITRDDFKPLISDLRYVPFNDIPSGTVNHHPSPIAPDGL